MELEDLRVFKDNRDPSLYKEGWSPILNRSIVYLLPALIQHGNEFINRIQKLQIVACGLTDNLKDNIPNTLTLLINTKSRPNLNKIPFVLNKYYFGELLYGPLEALVVEFPKKYINAIDNFKLGKYSKIYKNPKEVLDIKSPDKEISKLRNRALKICERNEEYREELIQFLNTNFITPDSELDTPPLLSQEIFNYGENKKPSYRYEE